MSEIEKKLAVMGLELPNAPTPVGSYIPAVRFCGNLVYLSGQGCRVNGKQLYAGKVGAEVTPQQGFEAAQQAALNCLAELKWCIGDLDKVVKIVKLLGFVASAPGFGEQPSVINGASNLLIELYGEKGRHARAAIGTSQLPFDEPVEIEILIEVEPE